MNLGTKNPAQRNLFNDDSAALGVIFVLLSAVAFGIQGVLTKISYQYDVTIIELLFYRKLLFVPLFWVFCLYKYPHDKIMVGRRDIILSISVGMIGYYLVPSISFTALKTIPADIERVVLYTFPAFVIILNSLVEKKLPPMKHIVAFLLIQFGIILLMGWASGGHIVDANLVGTLLMLVAAMLMAIYVILTQRIVRRIGTIIFMLWALTGSSVVILLQVMLSWNSVDLQLTNAGMVMVTLMMLVSFPSAILFAEGIKRIGGSRAALVSGAVPMLTLLFAYLLLDETLMPGQLIGAALVISAILGLERKSIGVFIKRRQLKQ